MIIDAIERLDSFDEFGQARLEREGGQKSEQRRQMRRHKWQDDAHFENSDSDVGDLRGSLPWFKESTELRPCRITGSSDKEIRLSTLP